MADHEYDADVVIVGAGIAGAIVAKLLADNRNNGGKLKRILILEAGKSTGYTPEGYRSYVEHYFEALAKVPNSPYPNNPDAPSANVLNVKQIPNPPPLKDGYLVQYGPLPFASDYTRAQGGTTLHWRGTCLRMLPNDFRLRSHYGHGVDWPISYQELRPYYERAEREIGVSADVEDQVYPGAGGDYFGAGYQYPMRKIPQSYLDQRLAADLHGMKVPVEGGDVEVRVESTPQGRNSTPNPDYDGGKGYSPARAVGDPETGQRCEGNSSCVPICPVQAKYNALKTLATIPTDRVEVKIQSRSVASQVLIDSDSGRVSGVVYKQYHDEKSPEYSTHTARAKIYVIAANAIEGAKLLLASNAANSSDQLGRNLMDHPVMITWGLMPSNVGAFRGPGSTSRIPSFRDGEFRHKHASFRVEIGNWGWNWAAGAPFSTVSQLVDQRNVFGKELRRRLGSEVPRQFRIGWEAEQLPEANNRVTIDSQYQDALGNYRPVIHYNLPDYTRAGQAKAKDVSDQMFRRLGVEDYTEYNTTDAGYFTYDSKGYTYNGAGHVVGTHRMGFRRGDSVVDRNQRCWDHENLYLVGCGNMPTLATSNPTLTIAALSIWAAENILKDLG